MIFDRAFWDLYLQMDACSTDLTQSKLSWSKKAWLVQKKTITAEAYIVFNSGWNAKHPVMQYYHNASLLLQYNSCITVKWIICCII